MYVQYFYVQYFDILKYFDIVFVVSKSTPGFTEKLHEI